MQHLSFCGCMVALPTVGRNQQRQCVHLAMSVTALSRNDKHLVHRNMEIEYPLCPLQNPIALVNKHHPTQPNIDQHKRLLQRASNDGARDLSTGERRQLRSR